MQLECVHFDCHLSPTQQNCSRLSRKRACEVSNEVVVQVFNERNSDSGLGKIMQPVE